MLRHPSIQSATLNEETDGDRVRACDDRSVSGSFVHHETVSERLVWKLNAGVWVFSAFVGFVPIHAGWNTVDGAVQNWAQPDRCVSMDDVMTSRRCSQIQVC